MRTYGTLRARRLDPGRATWSPTNRKNSLSCNGLAHQAVKYNVVPLDDRGFERINPDIAGRPQFDSRRQPAAVPRHAGPVRARPSASEQVPPGDCRTHGSRRGAASVIVTQGGQVGGWSLDVHDGRLKYCYNFLASSTSSPPLTSRCRRQAPGPHGVRLRRRRAGKGGTVTLYYDGKPVGGGQVDMTIPMGYSADEACDVGCDTGSPASPDHGPSGNRFTGKIDWVQIDIGDDSHDHPDQARRQAQACDGQAVSQSRSQRG